MHGAELASWVVMLLAAAALAGFVLGEWLRYVRRARNLGRALATVGAEERAVPRPGEASWGWSAELPRPSAIPPVSRARPAPAPGTVADGRR